MAKRFPNPLFYPAKKDFYHCELIDADPFLRIKTESGQTLTTQLVGAYNFENVAAALCVGKFFGVDEGNASSAIAAYMPGNMRSQVMKKGTNTIILDAYNANPSSMEVAISNLSSMKSTHKIAVLGDMYELGDESQSEHRRLGKLLKDSQIDEVLLCGVMIKEAMLELPSAKYFESKQNLIDYLQRSPIRNATILIKASRGMGLETLTEALPNN
jgi:UDP-N-acetylmuramoyl-tripeptide--D-alanyl-D-alanine ligase